MALVSHTGAFNITTAAAGNTVAVTGVGFTPKAIIFWWSGRTESANAGGSATSLRGMGFAVSSASFCARASRDQDAVGTSVTNNGGRDDACILELAADAFAGWADLQSMDADGFTIEILDQFVTDLRVHYIAYGGSDITNAEIGRFTATGTAPVEQDVTNSGFQPNITFFLMGAGSDPPSVGAPAFFSFGAATDASHQAVVADRANDAASSGQTMSYCRAGECAVLVGGTFPQVVDRAEFVSHNADGFTVNWLARVGAERVNWLSIQGGQWVIGDALTQTDTTTAIAESGFGFAPQSLLLASACRAQDTAGSSTAHAEWSVGAAVSTSNRRAQQTSSRNGNTNMFTQTFLRTDAVYINVDPTSDALEGLMDVQSFDSDGFTAIMDDADPSQAFFWYVAAGSAAGAVQRYNYGLLLGVN